MSQVLLNQKHTDPSRLRKERALGRTLKMSPWWKKKVAGGICFHCKAKTKPSLLTMDHLLPLARGGKSSKDNIVPSCLACNQSKGLRTDQDQRLEDLFQLISGESQTSFQGDTEVNSKARTDEFQG